VSIITLLGAILRGKGGEINKGGYRAAKQHKGDKTAQPLIDH